MGSPRLMLEWSHSVYGAVEEVMDDIRGILEL